MPDGKGIDDSLSLNKYTYCHNNPTLYNDPTGHVPFLVVTGIIGGVAGALFGGISSALSGKFSWNAVFKGAAIGGTIGITGGAALAYAAGFAQARQLVQAQQMRVVAGAEGQPNINRALETAQQLRKGGETIVGHALQKHAGRNPGIWGKVSGNADQINKQALKHMNDIINGSGKFEIFTTDEGIQFWEKMLSDGRGVRLNLDSFFKGFIDRIR